MMTQSIWRQRMLMLICAKQNVGSFGARPILQQQWWGGGGGYTAHTP